MKGITLLTISITSLLVSYSTIGKSLTTKETIKPNVGFDLYTRKQPFKPDFGEQHFKGHYPAAHFYVGTKFCQWLGIELGYTQMYGLQKRQFYYIFTPALGSDVFYSDGVLRGNALFFSEASLKGGYFDLIGFWPVDKRNEVTLHLGLALLRMHFETTFIQDNDDNQTNRPVYFNSNKRGLKRAGLGLRHFITPSFGIRLQAAWEETAKLHASTPVPVDSGGTPDPIVPTDNFSVFPKNSLLFGLGFFFEMH